MSRGINVALSIDRVSKMRIAIPIYGERVSPRIDCASSFLVVEAGSGSMDDVHEVQTKGPELCELFALLLQERIDVVVCGGIRREDRLALETAGIEVNGEWVGDVQDVLKSFASGQRDGSFHAPHEESSTTN